MAGARRHHHIPQFYLRGFATREKKHIRLTVANINHRTYFSTDPINVGVVRDFNRVEIEGFKPDALEGMLSNFEGEVATAVKNVEASLKFEGEDRNAILNLVALLAVRSPQMREHLRKYEEQLMKQMLSLLLASKDRWESQTAKMKADGHAEGDLLSYEEMKEHWKPDDYDISFNREHHIALELKTHDAVLRALDARKWVLRHIDKETMGCFVTSDRPVVVTWNNPEEIPVMMRGSPGYGMGGTEVLFPISKRLAALGTFEGESGAAEATLDFVAGANFRMFQNAFEQVYGPKRSVPYVGPDRNIYHDGRFLERWQRYKGNAPPGVEPPTGPLPA